MGAGGGIGPKDSIIARSQRRTPIINITTSASEKQDKNCRAALRRALKVDRHPDAAVLPVLQDVSDPWYMAKDGGLG